MGEGTGRRDAELARGARVARVLYDERLDDVVEHGHRATAHLESSGVECDGEQRPAPQEDQVPRR
jgi:hypothetical protein